MTVVVNYCFTVLTRKERRVGRHFVPPPLSPSVARRGDSTEGEVVLVESFQGELNRGGLVARNLKIRGGGTPEWN